MLIKYHGIRGITELNDFSLPKNQQRLNIILGRIIDRFLFGLPKLFSATNSILLEQICENIIRKIDILTHLAIVSALH